MTFAHGGIEAILPDADALAENRCLEGQRCQVAFHLTDVVLAQQLDILNARVFLVVHRHGTHLVQLRVQLTQIPFQIRWDGLLLFAHLAYALLRVPDFIERGLNALYEILVHLLAVVQEPRATLCLRHIRENHQRVIEGMMPEERLDATIGRQRLVLQFLIVNELRFVDEHPGEREGVGGAWPVLADDDSHGAVVERDDMLVVRRFNQGTLERLGRFLADDIVDILLIAPASPGREEPGEGICQAMFEGRHDDATRAALHALHVTEHEGSGDGVRLACASAGHNDRRIGTY